MKLKSLLFIGALLLISSSHAQRKFQKVYSENRTRNVVLILIDGYRWQELFNGADFKLLNNKKYNPNDSLQRFKKFWSDNLDERRKKLMPFTWNYIAKHGQLYGNRKLKNDVSVMNP
ncbi:MAG TPA: hypothetical protein VMU83_01870, partial [Hanamia sp.]|nr:hypothetical protein [Hanamia sp.]